MANIYPPGNTETLIFKNALEKFKSVDYDHADKLRLNLRFPLMTRIKEETEADLLTEEEMVLPTPFLKKPEGRGGLPPPLPLPKEKAKTKGTIKNVFGKVTQKTVSYGPSSDPGRNAEMNLTTNLNSKFTCTIFDKNICKPCKNLSGQIHKISSPPVIFIGDSHIQATIGGLSSTCPIILRSKSDATLDHIVESFKEFVELYLEVIMPGMIIYLSFMSALEIMTAEVFFAHMINILERIKDFAKDKFPKHPIFLSPFFMLLSEDRSKFFLVNVCKAMNMFKSLRELTKDLILKHIMGLGLEWSIPGNKLMMIRTGFTSYVPNSSVFGVRNVMLDFKPKDFFFCVYPKSDRDEMGSKWTQGDKLSVSL